MKYYFIQIEASLFFFLKIKNLVVHMFIFSCIYLCACTYFFKKCVAYAWYVTIYLPPVYISLLVACFVSSCLYICIVYIYIYIFACLFFYVQLGIVFSIIGMHRFSAWTMFVYVRYMSIRTSSSTLST